MTSKAGGAAAGGAAAAGSAAGDAVQGGAVPGGAAAFCDRCGGDLAGGHAACRVARELEPPRFCPACRRRMKVQVLPAGWRAECVEHGTLHG